MKFTNPPDLSGRTPLYRLSKSAPVPQPQPSATPLHPSPSQVNSPATTQPSQPPYHASPYTSPYTPSQPLPQSTPQDNKENAPAQAPQHTPNTDKHGSPWSRRRGRKLQENEVLILVNCCLEFQSFYRDNLMRFWYCVATSLKRQIKRNFSWQSCRQIVEELAADRRERRRDVAAGKAKEEPLTELVLATDKWISFTDAVSGWPPAMPAPTPAPTPTQTQPVKRTIQQDSPAADADADANAAKRQKQHDQAPSIQAPAPTPTQTTAPPVPHGPQPVPTPHIPHAAAATMPSGPTMSEFQTLRVDIQSLRLDAQTLRREIQEMRQEMHAKLDMILCGLKESNGK
ncbi:uncharacterized protein BJX67DRAFT_379553 [Aspergillus lucknowensis]|uniref:Uncharacterized protein n=1 Tax=Aspergillus lucknowensis TaxID=176173 RepID=A0ABR4LX15_9EURO